MKKRMEKRNVYERKLLKEKGHKFPLENPKFSFSFKLECDKRNYVFWTIAKFRQAYISSLQPAIIIIIAHRLNPFYSLVSLALEGYELCALIFAHHVSSRT